MAMLVAKAGNVVVGPIVSVDAINVALRSIGVVMDGARDDFEAVHLGSHRGTEDWLQP